jgi:phage tail protein X
LRTYRTRTGDTWDSIAFTQLGSEYLLPYLLRENQKYRLYVQLPAGLLLNIPDIELNEKRPEWLSEEEQNALEERVKSWLTDGG